ncbi:MAG: adenosylmethionine--8-amino-7-oxononanoate transaminase [Alphaproteobacteria bacterium]
MNYYDLGAKHLWLPYTQMHNHLKQLEVENAIGSKIFLKNQQVLVDGIASWWSVAHGYNHPYLVNEMIKQAQHLSHVMLAGMAMESTYKLAYRLAKFCALPKVFFSDSGSTAIEVAMKIAWQYHININQKNKTKFIAFKNSYHGDTTGAMSLADLSSGMHQKFKNLLLENYSLNFPQDLNQLDEFNNFLKKNNQQIAGIFIEPMIQCAGGMHFHNHKILKEIFKISKENKILIIADECATGFYRTQKKFAYQFTDLLPDILCVGKALSAGMVTLSATLCSEEIYQSFLGDSLDKALMHGPTFMGNALACSVANASIDLFEQEDYASMVSNIENILKTEFTKFKKFKRVKEINVLGAIGVVRIDLTWQETLKLRQRFIELGVFIRPFANTIYLMPALNISKEELLLLTKKISQVLTEIS